VVVACWLLGGAIWILVKAARRLSVFGVAFVVKVVGAVVGSNVVVVVIEKKDLVDDVDNSVAGLDVKGCDFWQGILAVAVANLEDIVVDALGRGSATVQHRGMDQVLIQAGKVLEIVGILCDVVLEDFSEQGIVAVIGEGRVNIGREIGKGGVGGGKDGKLTAIAAIVLIQYVVEVGIFQQVAKVAQAWSGTGEGRDGLALYVVVVAPIVTGDEGRCRRQQEGGAHRRGRDESNHCCLGICVLSVSK